MEKDGWSDDLLFDFAGRMQERRFYDKCQDVGRNVEILPDQVGNGILQERVQGDDAHDFAVECGADTGDGQPGIRLKPSEK